MRRMNKTILALLLSVTMAGATAAPVSAQSGAEILQQTDDAVAAEKLLSDVKGDYVPLFQGALFEEKYNQYWHDQAAAVVGESMANDAVTIMKASIGADTYGENMEKDQQAFCCKFINGVKEISFQGEKIEITKEDGTKVAHTYKYVREDAIGGAMPGYAFQSTDDNEDEFKYFFLCGDTPGSTYHIEFRYGSDLDELLKLNSGRYANWMGSGILKTALTEENDAMVQNCIALFCVENLSEMKSDETTAQRAPFVGTWDADMTPFRDVPEYKDMNLSCVFGADGSGATYVDANGTGEFVNTSSYEIFVYDNDNNPDTNTGMYTVMDTEGKLETSHYAITQDGDRTLLRFDTLDGETLTYIKRQETENKVSIAAEKASLYVKGSVAIQAKVVSGNETITYESSNPAVATVDDKGNVTALKKGTATITVSNGGEAVKFVVIVKNPSLNKKNVSLKKGKTATLRVNGKIGKVTYKSANSKIAKVNAKGQIKAVKAGTTTITVKANGITLKCKVKVTK